MKRSYKSYDLVSLEEKNSDHKRVRSDGDIDAALVNDFLDLELSKENSVSENSMKLFVGVEFGTSSPEEEVRGPAIVFKVKSKKFTPNEQKSNEFPLFLVL